MRPAEGDALGGEGLLAEGLGDLDGIKANLGLEIPDDDGRSSSSAEPVADRGEDEGVDDLTSLKRVEVLASIDVPEHGGTILTTGSAERAIGGDNDGVDIALVTNEVILDLELSHVPDLDNLVPTSGNEGGDLGVGGEADARDPLLVAISVQGVLALTESVPELDGLVAGTRDNLAVIGGDSDGEDILLVADEAESAVTGLDVPETDRTIPRSGKGIEAVLVVNGEGEVLDEVVVAGEALNGDSEGVGGLIALDLPDDDGLIAGSGDDEIRLISVGSDGGDPTVVALQLTLENKLLSGHSRKERKKKRDKMRFHKKWHKSTMRWNFTHRTEQLEFHTYLTKSNRRL